MDDHGRMPQAIHPEPVAMDVPPSRPLWPGQGEVEGDFFVRKDTLDFKAHKGQAWVRSIVVMAAFCLIDTRTGIMPR